MSYNPYRKYSSFWWKFWGHLPSDIRDFVVRLWTYAPLIWEDRDWDYAFLLRMIKFKLKRMQPIIRDGIALHSHHKALEIHQAEIMIENIFEDPDDEWMMHHGAWHQGKELDDPCPQSEEECHKALMASHHRDERNWHALWKHLDDNMRGWWD